MPIHASKSVAEGLTVNPLQRRLLAVLDDKGDEVSAAGLAAELAASVSEIEEELETLVRLGNLARRMDGGGGAVYSTRPRRNLLGRMLVEAGLLTPAQLEQALAEQARTGDRLGRILVDRGFVPKQTLGEMLEVQRHLPYINLTTHAIDESLVRAIPDWVVTQHKVFPVGRDGREITLAMLDPNDVVAIDTVARLLGARVRPVITTEGDFDWAVGRYFDVARKVGETLQDVYAEEDTDHRGAVTMADSQESAPVVRVLNSIIQDAVRIGATDVHIEPGAEDTAVRVRIDGLLHEKTILPRAVSSAVASRLKVLAGLDIAERFRPQDGRILLTIDGRDFDLRLATVGTAFGERVAIRLLNTRQVMLGLERLGLFPEQRETLRGLLARPHGMILVTGPTGSGKTTTLYAAIGSINERSRNIMTIEDPVEYRLPGITQIPVNEKAGMTFDIGLRSILRQDPDIIMVGEVRDPDTASIAVNASLTGHLVLTTLHTGNAAGALVRLLDMAVEPYMITSSVLAVAGQRLMRMLCPTCKRQQEQVSDADMALLSGAAPGLRPILFTPAGCPECGGLGYRGRTGVFEIMVLTQEIRELVLRRQPVPAMRTAAKRSGMQSLRQSAVRKVLEGVTSVDELRRLMASEVEE